MTKRRAEKKQTEHRQAISRQINIFLTQSAEVILVGFVLNFSFTLACKLSYNAYFPIGKANQVVLCAVVTCAGILVLALGKYFSVHERTFAETISRLLATIAVTDFLFVSLVYSSLSVHLSPYLFVLTNAIQITLLLLLKALFRKAKQVLLEENRVLIISRNETNKQALTEALAQSIHHVVYLCFDEDVEAIGSRIERNIRTADVIYLCDDLTKAEKDKLISYCIFNDKNVYLVPETYEIALRRSELTQIGDVPVFNISSFRLTQTQLFAKRILDIVGSLVGLILSIPVWIVAIVLIKREDGGAVFFKQTRAGQSGREFDVIKLRTMIPDAEKHTGAIFAQEDDPRITRIGKTLRAMRIDEIPQFLNVLKGDMSLVGPRPERPVFVKEFTENLPEYSARLMVKPGITGLAQVLGNYTTSAGNKAKFDLVYIRNYSFWLDIKILLKTVAVVFTKEQAEGVRAKEAKAQIADFDLEEDGLAYTAKPPRKRSWIYQGIKTAALVSCVIIALSGIVVLRYSNLLLQVIAESPEDIFGAVVAMAEIDGKNNVDQATGTDDAETEKEVGMPESSDGLGGSGSEEVAGSSGGSEVTGKTVTNAGDGQIKPATMQAKQYMTSRTTQITDQASVMFKLVTKISTEDILIIEDMAADGFTGMEKETVRQIMAKYFTQDEIECVLELYRHMVRGV